MRRFAASKCLVVAAALVAGFTSRAIAQRNDQNPGQIPRPPQEQAQDPAAATGQPGQPNQMLDHIAANSMRQMSQGEIELANFALKHTQNEEVRRYAQMVVQDHTNLNNQLERFTGEGAHKNAAAQPTDRPAAPTGAEPGTSPAATAGERNPVTEPSEKTDSLTAVRRDISNQVITNIERELGQFQGNDFDRAYLGQQFWSHVVFVASASAGGKHLSGDLKQIADEAATRGQKHLEDCRKLIRDLSANVARGNETAPRR